MTVENTPQSKPKRRRSKQIGLGARSRQGGVKNYYPYDLCKQVVHQFQFKTRTAYEKWIKAEYEKYPLVPLAPKAYYEARNVSFSWDDFLGETFVLNKVKNDPSLSQYVDYQTFVDFVLTNKIICQKQWDQLYERGAISTDYPKIPARVYRSLWEGWSRITGIDVRGRGKFEKIQSDKTETKTQNNVLQLLPFHLFKQEVRRQCFSFKQQYFDWVKENNLTSKGFSNNPDTYYMKLGQWTDWPDVLGIFDPNTPTYSHKCDYIQSKKFVQSLGLKSVDEWRQWCSQNNNVRPDVPRYPDSVYREWEGWDIFLGKHISEIIKTTQHNTAVLWIAKTVKKFDNVFEISIDVNGIASAYEDVLITREYELVALFEYEERVFNNVPLETIIKRIIDRNVSGVYQRWIGGMAVSYDGVIVTNVYQLMYELTEFLVPIPIVIPEHIRIIKRKYEQAGINNHQTSQASLKGLDDEHGVEDLL